MNRLIDYLKSGRRVRYILFGIMAFYVFFTALIFCCAYLFYSGHINKLDFSNIMAKHLGGFFSGLLAVVFVLFFLGFFAFLCIFASLNRRVAESFKETMSKKMDHNVSEVKTEFLANMSHEIRTPVNIILGMNNMILRTTSEASTRQYADNIESAGKSLLGLINDILDFSKISTGKFSIVETEYAFSDIIKDTIRMFKPRVESKNLVFTFDVDPFLPSVFYGDNLRIQQIINNLLSNAVKYTDTGSVNLKISSIPSEQADQIVLVLEVADTGKGINKADMELLFKDFERLDMYKNKTIEGTGLGLAITKSLIDLMHGSINVESDYGKGSVFTVSLPQRVVDPAPLGDVNRYFYDQDAHSKEYHPRFIAPRASVLVVDDTEMNLVVLKHLLSGTKVHIDTCKSGAECIEIMHDIHYDVVFLDIRMPGMDGVETLETLRRENLVKDTVVIALTADAVNGAKDRYLNKGFEDYLSKPVDPQMLEQVLFSYLPDDKIEEEFDTLSSSDDEQLPEWLKNIHALNIREGISFCGSARIYLDTVKNYASAFSDNMAVIKKSLAVGDIDMYTTKVHALKSSSRIIGALELSDRFAVLEEAGDRKDTVYIRKHTGEVLDAYAGLCEQFRPLIVFEGVDKTGIMIDIDHVAGLYRHLKEYVEEFNDEALSSMLRALSRYDFPDNEQDRFNALVDAHSRMDWKEMSDILEEF